MPSWAAPPGRPRCSRWAAPWRGCGFDRGLLVVASGAVLAKLVAYPLLVWLVLGPLLRLEPFWVHAGVLLAAMPTASNAFVMAQRNHAAADEVSAAVLFSTLIAALAFPATAWLAAPAVAIPGSAALVSGPSSAAHRQRMGGAYISPPRVQRSFSPRSQLDRRRPGRALRSKTSP